MSHSHTSGQNGKGNPKGKGKGEVSGERGRPAPQRRKPYNGMGFLGHGARPHHEAERSHAPQPEAVDPEKTYSRHDRPGPMEVDAIMGTFNLRKGKGHVRLDGNASDTATCTDAVFLAAGMKVPDEHTPLRVNVVRHPNGQKEVLQIVMVDAPKAYPFETIVAESEWVRAVYRGFKHRQGLGILMLEGLETLVFAFHQTLSVAGLLDETGVVVEVRHGKTTGGTPIAAEIRRISG